MGEREMPTVYIEKELQCNHQESVCSFTSTVYLQVYKAEINWPKHEHCNKTIPRYM